MMIRYILITTLIVAIFAFTSCKEKEETMPELTNKFTYLALGDSYTIGEGVAKEDRWGERLVDLLRENDVDISDPVIIARTGWTTSELASAIQSEDPRSDYDLVSLLIGVNNQYRGQSLTTYRTEFNELLQTAIRLAGNNPDHVIVLSTPDWGATPFAAGRNRQQIADEIDAFNAVARQEAQNADIAFIDITPLTRQYGNDVTYLANDRLHYSGKMHLEWAKLALPVAMNILEE